MVGKYSHGCLVVMAKAPIAGMVKTRLIPALGSKKATQTYIQLLSHTIHTLSDVPDSHRIISCSPDSHHQVFQQLARKYAWRLQRQPSGNLGQRMSRIFALQLKQYSAVVLVGSDLVNLNTDLIKWAFAALRQDTDLVLGTTEDGGYGLIAMKQLHAGLFRNIPWSTGRVADITLKYAHQRHLRATVLEGLWDVDNANDYRRWRGLLV